MKKLIIITLFALITGCGAESTNRTAHSEHDIVKSGSFRADLNNIILLNVEHNGASASENDLHTVGTDCVTYNLSDKTELTLSVDDNMHLESKTLIEADSGVVLASVSPGETSEIITMYAGEDYTICVKSHETATETRTVFIKVSNNSEARYSTADLNTLTATYSCPDCDLSGVYLTNDTSMMYANLNGANLSNMACNWCNITDSTITNANLDNSSFDNNASLNGTNFTGSSLKNSIIMSTDIGGADFTSTNLTNTDFSFSDVSYSTFDHAIVNGATFDGFSYFGTKTCAEGSYGECK